MLKKKKIDPQFIEACSTLSALAEMDLSRNQLSNPESDLMKDLVEKTVLQSLAAGFTPAASSAMK